MEAFIADNIMFAVHAKQEAAHTDGLWCCDWTNLVPEEDAEGSGEQGGDVEKIIVTGGVDDVVKIWNFADGEFRLKHQGRCISIGWLSELCVKTGAVKSKSLLQTLPSSMYSTVPQLADHSLGVVSVVLSSDGSCLASSSLDSVIMTWDTRTGAKLATMETGPVDAWTVCFTADNQVGVSLLVRLVGKGPYLTEYVVCSSWCRALTLAR